MKKCSKCKEEKPLTQFYRQTRSKDGYRAACKTCCRYTRKKDHPVSVEHKRCRRCDTVKTAERFYEEGRKPDGLSSYCRYCTSVMQAAYRYGISESEVEELKSSSCHICGQKQDTNIDHCHETGAVRGALCGACNKAIGLLKDDPSLAESAADYLRRKR